MAAPSYKIANNYREFIADDKLATDLRRRFEDYTGPPVNKGGVTRITTPPGRAWSPSWPERRPTGR